MKRKRRRVRRRRRAAGPWSEVRSVSIRWSAAASLGFLLYVLLVNGLVRRVGGGDPGWLSLRHLGNKSTALLALGRHALSRHALPTGWGDADGSPEQAVRQAALRHGLAPHVALAVARAESSLRPHSISATGAMGLMQLMPATARELDVLDPFDPVQNADGGVRYLVWLRRRYQGDLHRMLAAYNAGPGTVPKQGNMLLPRETVQYVSRILGE